jgi:hypothetical protein
MIEAKLTDAAAERLSSIQFGEVLEVAAGAVSEEPPLLLGVAEGGGRRWAYFAGSARTRAFAGDEIAGWRVTAITPNAVSLRLGEREVMLRPFSKRPAIAPQTGD